jgi:uncharacterized membrane protein
MRTRMLFDMGLKDLLQGKWLGHPLHPALVHVPTGLWPAALIFDLVNYFGPHTIALARVSCACIGLGILAALLAIPTGLADWWEIKPDKPARTLGWWHMGLNVCVFALMAASLWMRCHGAEGSATPIILCAAGTAILFVSGYLGGRMVYEYGTGVARMSKDKWRRMAREGHAHVPPAES